MAQKLNLNQRLIEAIRLAAPLHDVGKIAIPESILHKPGRLNDEERQIMQTHAEVGSDILSKSNVSQTIKLKPI